MPAHDHRRRHARNTTVSAATAAVKLTGAGSTPADVCTADAVMSRAVMRLLMVVICEKTEPAPRVPGEMAFGRLPGGSLSASKAPGSSVLHASHTTLPGGPGAGGSANAARQSRSSVGIGRGRLHPARRP
jgi:hypothetical protein